MRLPIGVLTGGILILAGCAPTTPALTPKVTETYETPMVVNTDWFSVKFAGFIYDLEAPRPFANYEISLELLQKRESDIYVKVAFEDPENVKRKLVKKLLVRPTATTVNVTSPNVYGLRGDWDYWIDVTTYADEFLKVELDHFKQRVRSYVDWETIEQQ